MTADFNGDGRPDVAVSNANNQGSQISNIGSVSVFLAMPGGMLQAAQSYTVGYAPEGLAAGDFNGDSAIDLVTTNVGYGMAGNDADASTVKVRLGNGNATFQTAASYATSSGARALATADFNLDGRGDLASANSGTDNISVLLGLP